jgi:peptidoglycan/xylan/chitin deacetylase (PgdA/CDA1 family)
MLAAMNFPNIPVLAYHEIASDPPAPDYWWAVSVRQFKREMQYLYNHQYQSVSLTELLQCPDITRSNERKLVAITFDDGFRDFFTLASPILNDYGFTASVFIIINKIQNQSEVNNAYLTWEQIKALQKRSFSFGSHTCTHRKLPGLTREEIQCELVISKQHLEARLGLPVDWLVYPYGASTREIQEMVEAAGYKAAFGGSFGKNTRYNLKRHIILARDTLTDFALGLNRYFLNLEYLGYYKVIRQFLRKVKGSIVYQHVM